MCSVVALASFLSRGQDPETVPRAVWTATKRVNDITVRPGKFLCRYEQICAAVPLYH